MTILNLKTFETRIIKKGRHICGDTENYHLFTNGTVVYGIRKGSEKDNPNYTYLQDRIKTYLPKDIPSVTDLMINIENGNYKEIIDKKEVNKQKLGNFIKVSTLIEEDTIETYYDPYLMKVIKANTRGYTIPMKKFKINRGYLALSEDLTEFITIMPLSGIE